MLVIQLDNLRYPTFIGKGLWCGTWRCIKSGYFIPVTTNNSCQSPRRYKTKKRALIAADSLSKKLGKNWAVEIIDEETNEIICKL